jgi:peptidoglycan DL-endopeptidase CwlO
MSRARRSLSAVLVCIAALGVVPGNARADSVQQQQRKADQLAAALEQLGDEATSLAEDYQTTLSNLADLKVEITASEQRVAELEQQLGIVQAQVGELALQTFVSGDQVGGLGELLTDSDAINVAVEREQYTRLALSAGQSSTDELDATLNDLDKERAELARKQKRAEEFAGNLQARQDEVERKTNEYQVLKAAAEKELGQLLAEARARRAAAEEAAARASRPSASAGGGGGNGSGGGGGGGATPAAGGGGGDGGSAGGGSPTPRPGADVPPPSPGAGGAVNAAISQLGVGYRYAAAEPGVAFDCSGLTMWAWAQAGVHLPHYSKAQFESVPHVPADQAQPGDLIFYKNPVGHVGMYIGGGQMIHAPRTGDVVKIVAVNWAKVRDGIVGRPG